MSVGVCIINRNGIALAADSAGTYTGNKMFYNSMNKVFSLSRKNVYGAITYGGTTIHNVSIDQILKEFRKYLDAKDSINNFFEILPLFEEFIKQNNIYYKFNFAESINSQELIKALVDEWGNKIKSVINLGEMEIDGVINELDSKIKNAIRINTCDLSEYISETYIDYFNLRVGIVVPEINQFPDKKDIFWKLICDYFNLSLESETKTCTGLFFAGYGDLDAFPKLIHIKLYNVIGGKIKYELIEQYEESNNHAQIIPLAQPDVILTFCKGISGMFTNYIPQKIESIFNEKLCHLSETFTDEQKEELKNVFLSTKKELMSSINETIQNKNVKPILDSVQLIPLPEMALLAENLVNITSLKRTFAIDGYQQTVGGPTDVAVLSKGDGFVWIKRKHYFDKQINADYSIRIAQE